MAILSKWHFIMAKANSAFLPVLNSSAAEKQPPKAPAQGCLLRKVTQILED